MRQGELLYTGKAKSVYRTDEEGVLMVEFRDDITAFDGGKKDVLTKKGSFNAGVSAFLFRRLQEEGVLTHFLGMVDESKMLVHALEMVPIEVIVRNVAAGSMVRKYPIAEGTPLDPPVIVMDYKDDTRHDPMLNDELIIALRLLSPGELNRVKEDALKINRFLSRFFDSLGITLVDFKMEFGKLNGEIVLGDEISMDSMRLWDKNTGESLDKDVYRFSKGDVISAYRRVAEKILASGEQQEIRGSTGIMTKNPEGVKDIMSEDKLEEEILDWVRDYAREKGWRLNPEEKKLSVVIRGLARNQKKFGHRYCPCRLRSGDTEKDKSIICPCIFHEEEVRDQGSCHCNLYYQK